MKVASIRLCPVAFSLPTPNGHRYLLPIMNRPALSVLALLVLSACRATAPVGPAPEPEAVPARARGTLPPIPLVEGPLAPRVVYPQPNGLIQSRDSNFIIGSIGNGRATLTINGAPVPVA